MSSISAVTYQLVSYQKSENVVNSTEFQFATAILLSLFALLVTDTCKITTLFLKLLLNKAKAIIK